MRLAARFSGFFAFVIFMLSVSNVQAQDYVLAFNARYSWRVDLVPEPCDTCRKIVRFDRNYVMYVLVDKMLYTLQPDGSAPTVFDMSEIFAGAEDMIPFEDGTVLFLAGLAVLSSAHSMDAAVENSAAISSSEKLRAGVGAAVSAGMRCGRGCDCALILGRPCQAVELPPQLLKAR